MRIILHLFRGLWVGAEKDSVNGRKGHLLAFPHTSSREKIRTTGCILDIQAGWIM
jgi:hypothetical protein